MISARNVHILFALGALTALPACSNMMGNRSSTASASTAPAPQPVANDMVKQVQGKLQQDGYYKQGNVDGVWGAGTMNAVEAFQRDHNLSATGKLDVPTLQALNITDTGNNPSNNNPTPTNNQNATGNPHTNNYNTGPNNPNNNQNNPNRQP
jgi:peptidoglycan hydrolase-like protein with peptidoglycan-binding domain